MADDVNDPGYQRKLRQIEEEGRDERLQTLREMYPEVRSVAVPIRGTPVGTGSGRIALMMAVLQNVGMFPERNTFPFTEAQMELMESAEMAEAAEDLDSY